MLRLLLLADGVHWSLLLACVVLHGVEELALPHLPDVEDGKLYRRQHRSHQRLPLELLDHRHRKYLLSSR